MTDIVKRLRSENAMDGYYAPRAIQLEAADRIEHLERELEQERQSRIAASERGWAFADRLKRMADAFAAISVSDDLKEIHKIARKALSPEP